MRALSPSQYARTRGHSLVFAPVRLCAALSGRPDSNSGTSPTRTVRATRLRHAPTRREYPTPLVPTRQLRRLARSAIVAPCPHALTEILAELDPAPADTISGLLRPTACRSPARPRSPRSPPAYPPARSCSSCAAPSGPICCSSTTASSGARAPGPIDASSSAGCSSCSTPTSRSPPTTCRSTRIPELGNNALLATALGAQRLDEPFALHRGEPIGCLVRFQGERRSPATELFARVRALTEREPLVFDAGPSHVRTLAIVSGGGCDYLADAAPRGPTHC